MPHHVLLCLCALLLVSTCLTTTRAEDLPRLHVQVVHNHGVRLPITPHNETSICGKGHSSGELSDAKFSSMKDLGKILKDIFLHLGDPKFTELLKNSKYNATLVHSSSINDTRTIQSSGILFSEIFPSLMSLPIIHSTDLTDMLLNTTALPAVYSQYKYGMPEIRAACTPLLERLLTPKVLQEIGKEVYSDGYCSEEGKGVDCAMLLCDIGTSYTVARKLTASHKMLKQHLDELCSVTVCVSNYTLGYDRGNPLNVLQGSKGQVLAQKLLTNMHDFLNNKSKVILHDYSTSGDAITALASTLGVHSPPTLHPSFGMSLLFLLKSLNNVSTVSIFSFHIQKKHSDLIWEFTKLPQMKIANISDVWSTNNKESFKLEEFEALIKSSAPKSKEGMCYLDPVLKKRMNCSAGAGESTKHSSEEDCLFYQRQCSEFVNEKGYRLSLPNFTYYSAPSIKVITKIIGFSFSTIAVICVAAPVIGILIGMAIFYFRNRCMDRRKPSEAAFNAANDKT